MFVGQFGRTAKHGLSKHWWDFKIEYGHIRFGGACMVYRPLRGPVQSRGNWQPPFITTRCFLKMWHNLGMRPQPFKLKEYMALAMYRLALYSTSYLIGMHIVISLFIIFLLHYSLNQCHHIIYCHHHPNASSFYRMAGNFGGEFILADWWFWEQSANISSAK